MTFYIDYPEKKTNSIEYQQQTLSRVNGRWLTRVQTFKTGKWLLFFATSNSPMTLKMGKGYT